MDAVVPNPGHVGTYLRERRARLDPSALGFAAGGRGTPGLRREEVASRAGIRPPWYTWLEPGRGGAPSPDVLDRIARALLLTDLEREHLFLLALGRPPEARFRNSDAVSPRLQRVLAALDPTPALVRTAIWDVVAWNEAATVMLVDYGTLVPAERNILRMMFLDRRARASQDDWEGVARVVVGAFRVDAVRAGAADAVAPLVAELCRDSPDFARLWRDADIQNTSDHIKHIRHPVLGPLAFDYSAFAVDGRPDLSLVVYTPATDADAARISAAVAARRARGDASRPLGQPAHPENNRA